MSTYIPRYVIVTASTKQRAEEVARTTRPMHAVYMARMIATQKPEKLVAVVDTLSAGKYIKPFVMHHINHDQYPLMDATLIKAALRWEKMEKKSILEKQGNLSE